MRMCVRAFALVMLIALPAMLGGQPLRAESTLDRGVLWSAQTPQVFRADLFRELLDRARREGYRATDDAALHETYVGPVPIVRGDPHNWKLTWPGELAAAEAVLRERAARSETA